MNSSNITKYKRRKDVNIAVIVFLIIFIYVMVYVYIFMTKEHLSIYEVKEGYATDNNVYNGIILRNEEIFTSDTAGYINYYYRDGDRVGKNTTVYSIAQNRSSFELSNEEGFILSSKDNNIVKKEISDFQKKYLHSNFSQVYDFKYKMENVILEIINDNKLSSFNNALDRQQSSMLYANNSNYSGIITYNMDGYETLTPQMISKDHFNTDNYSKEPLRTMELIEKDSAVYRLIKSDNWNIVLSLDQTQYNKLIEQNKVKIILGDEELVLSVPIEVYKVGDDYYANLSLSKYMIQFINQRFVKVEIVMNTAKGLKIPVSSVVEKDFFMIPLEYFTTGGDSNSKGVIKVNYLPDGEVEHIFVPTDIYYSDDGYGYVDGRLFDHNTWIISEGTSEKFRISLIGTLKGVFNVNKGYAVFRRIEVLYENEEYCIINKNTQYGLSVFDHIALVGTTAIEQAVIY